MKEGKTDIYCKSDVTIPVNKLDLGTNFTRIDLASCKTLAETIAACNGRLLEPVGVTPSLKAGRYIPVFGFRRIAAVTEILKLPKIDARVFTNKDGSPLTKSQMIQLNAIENQVRRQPAILELGPQLMELVTKEKKGFNTLSKEFHTTVSAISDTITAWKIVPKEIINQVKPKKLKSELGLSQVHIYKTVRFHKSTKITKEQVTEALMFVLNHSTPVSEHDYVRALKVFVGSNDTFSNVYTALTKKRNKLKPRTMTLCVNGGTWDKHFNKKSMRTVLQDLLTDLKAEKFKDSLDVLNKIYRCTLIS